MSEELINRLAELASSSVKARMTVDLSGLPIHSFDFTGPPQTMWYNVLSEARKHNDGILKIINVILNDYPEDEVLLSEKSKLSSNPPIPPQPQVVSTATSTQIDKSALKSMVGSNKIKKVIEELKSKNGLLEEDAQNELLGIERQHKSLETKDRKGIISVSDYNLGINTITNNLLNFIDSIDT